MDPRLLAYYNRELQFVREMGGEFAQAFPKIASRLGLEGLECADPYVERLLEGFAFLAARVQLKLDAEYPHFTQHLLEMTYPQYLAPTPSMGIVELQPRKGVSPKGFTLPRDTALRANRPRGDQTSCEFRTAHEVTLWPVEIGEVEYLTHARGITGADPTSRRSVEAAVRIALRTTEPLPFKGLALDELVLFVRGSNRLAMHLYEQLLANATGVAVRWEGKDAPVMLPASTVTRFGFDDEQALLPYRNRAFHGYRLLHEYFAFPDRFLFVRLQGLGRILASCDAREVELVVLLDRLEPELDHAIDARSLSLHCTPAVNLFPRRADRIHIEQGRFEYHVVPDRTRPMDLEVYQVETVTGFGSGDLEVEFRPFYHSKNWNAHEEDRAYYTARRAPRALSARQKQDGPRSSYVGSEVFVSLVDAREAPFCPDLRQLGLNVLCTNRDLSLRMPVGLGATDFSLMSGGPVQAVRCISGPTRPRVSWPSGETAWRLISHLSLNYLSLVDQDVREGAVALRELLGLYADLADPAARKQIEGVQSISASPIVRRIPAPGPVAFGRGLGIEVTLEDAAFEGSGCYLLASVLEHFFTRYTSINSFTETTLRTVERGEVTRWAARPGLRHAL